MTCPPWPRVSPPHTPAWSKQQWFNMTSPERPPEAVQPRSPEKRGQPGNTLSPVWPHCPFPLALASPGLQHHHHPKHYEHTALLHVLSSRAVRSRIYCEISYNLISSWCILSQFGRPEV